MSSYISVLPEAQTIDLDPYGPDLGPGVRCPLPLHRQRPGTLTARRCAELEKAGCPLAAPVRERLRFETLLAELSATFVNLPADQVDTQIESALGQLVEFLDVDRAGLAELFTDQLVVTHAYHRPETPRLPRIILNEQLPWYARRIKAGEVFQAFRLPDDLPFDATADRTYCQTIGLKSHLMIPLKVMGSVTGALGFGSFRAYREWPHDLVRRLRLVGEIFTNALARKRADEELRDREQSLRQAREGLRRLAVKLLGAQEEERRRIAREMHDDWTQRLALLSIDIARVQKHLATPDSALDLLRAMQAKLVSLSEDVHALSRQLHPSILDDLGLVEALRSECAGFSRREGIAVAYHPKGTPALPKEAALCIYRVAQEALRNIAKHAAVKKATLTLDATGPELLLQVEDRGRGFDPARLRLAPGLGLSSMEERVRLIQARLSLRSAAGKGTLVEVSVPQLRRETE
jgi:signal transduction histidine kinase